TLSVDQHVAHGKILRHPHDRVVYRLVAVGVILTDHITHDTGGFLVGPVPIVVELVHGIQHAPMHRLEAVAHVWQRPSDDHAHGVIQVAATHLFFQRYRKRLLGEGIHIYRATESSKRENPSRANRKFYHPIIRCPGSRGSKPSPGPHKPAGTRLLPKTNIPAAHREEKLISSINAAFRGSQRSSNALTLFPARRRPSSDPLNLFWALLYWPRFPDMRRGFAASHLSSFKLNEEKHEQTLQIRSGARLRRHYGFRCSFRANRGQLAQSVRRRVDERHE